ncbi:MULTISPECIES: hypothetical protein [Bradyrhizobium]|uniref:MSHA biogenesis protein MshQ n=2 Tax=Bradyrhizobium TaxID=374 RepID=A0ABY0Q7K7_9BRAD|nr:MULTISPECIES: hypothetical protein [Bradyrhizobium]SDJ65056.1 MSHA biogenesis protein MshQ [Bradyrhizobium ottawaense]SEC31248.1 MSHA biogenesis protein MshQ [Bradyrhizobium lablabi]
MKLVSAVAAIALAASVASANAAILDLHLTADNQFSVYLSTSDSTLGAPIGGGADWQTTYSYTANLVAGTNYYIHVVGTNWTSANGFPYGPPGDPSNPDAFIGSFNISGGGFQFSNGTSSLVTNTTDWKASAVSDPAVWSAPTGTPQAFAFNGGGIWGSVHGSTAGVGPTAQWIWSQPDNGLYAEFSAQITAVPEASTWAMMILGFLGLGFLAYRKAPVVRAA